MLFERQRLLLALVDAFRSSVMHTDFQKFLFLYTREWEKEPSYDFIPYQFGGFSFSSYADKRRLIERGLLADDENSWTLTEAGRRAILPARALRERVKRFALRYETLRGDALIADQYLRYPYYATRSKIVDRVLTSTEDRARVQAAQPVARDPGVVTIGYEGKTLESYLNQLLQDSVTLLCDVRRNPLSRKYGFAKGTLSKACEGVGIRYEHLPELGIESEDRKDLVTQADYDALFRTYKQSILPRQTDALNRIRLWVGEGERVALTCYEAQVCQCHRHCVADALEKGGGRQLLVSHL